MTSIDDSTQTVDTHPESNDWQDVVFHAKAMQQAIERYKSNCATSSQDINSTSSVTSQLSATGTAILTFVNTIADTVDPLIKSLNSGTPLDAVSEITKKVAPIPYTQKLTTAQDEAMQKLKSSLSAIDAPAPSLPDNDKKQSTVAGPDRPLSPDMQAIKDTFDEMMGGKMDPRMGLGKIPPQFLPKTQT